MSKFAELPDGTRLEFPDDTEDSVIDGVVKKHLGVPATKEFSFGQEALATGKQAASNIGNLIVTTPNLMAGGLLNKFADVTGSKTARELGDDFFKRMEETNQAIALDTENAPQSLPGKVVAGAAPVIGAVAMGGGAIPAMLASGFGSMGQSQVQQGVDSTTAATVAGIDTAGNLAGALVPGGRIVQALANPVAGGATDAVNQQILKSQGYDKVAEGFDPLNPERRLTDAFVGGILPPGLRNKPEEVVQKPKVDIPQKELPRNVDAELIKRAQKNAEHQLDALILLRKQYEDAIEAGDNSPETIAAHQEVTSQIQHVTRILETAIAEQSGNQHPTRVAQGEDINAIKEARNKAFVEKQNLIDPNDPWAGIPTIPVKKGQLGPDEVAPVHEAIPEGPPRHVGEFDPETGQMVKEGTPPVDPTPEAPKQTPMQVAQDRVRQVMEDGTKLNDFKERAQMLLDDLPNRVPRDDTPGSHYSALKEALEAELAYYNKKTEPVVETKSTVPDIVEPKGMGIDVFKNIQDLFKQLQSTDVGLDKLRYYQQWAKDGMQRMAGFGEGQRGYDPTHDYTITWENLKKTHDFLAEKIAQKEAEAYKEPVQTEPSGPKTYDTMEALVRDTKSDDPVIIANQRRMAMEQNPQLFTTPKGTTVKFSTEIPKMLRDIITHFMKITKMDQDGIFVVFDPTLTARGRLSHSGDKGIMYLNPVGIKEHGTWLSKQPVLKEMFAAGRMKDVLDNVMLSRYAAHEMGHFLLNKYLTQTITHIKDLQHIEQRWKDYLANNKLNAISVFDIDKPQHRADYQKAFHEFFSEQLAKELLHKQLVDKFTFGKGKEASKHLDNLKRIVYHSAKYVEGLVGKHIDMGNCLC